jgi:hypothetical protein
MEMYSHEEHDERHQPNSVDAFLESLSEKSTGQSHGFTNRDSPEYAPNPAHSSAKYHVASNIVKAEFSDEPDSHDACPKMKKKGIRKQYEPIIDNNIVYEFTENPEEYRKARK